LRAINDVAPFVQSPTHPRNTTTYADSERAALDCLLLYRGRSLITLLIVSVRS
jgi:hypothetical protein